MTKRRMSRIDEVIIEAIDDFRDVLRPDTIEKITMRILGKAALPKPEILSPAQIRALREQSGISQAVFARHLNVTTGYISQLERGAKQPTGPLLVLLHAIKRRGLEVIA